MGPAPLMVVEWMCETNASSSLPGRLAVDGKHREGTYWPVILVLKVCEHSVNPIFALSLPFLFPLSRETYNLLQHAARPEQRLDCPSTSYEICHASVSLKIKI